MNSPKPTNADKNTRPPTSKPTAAVKGQSVNGLGRSPSYRGGVARAGRGGTGRPSPRPGSSNAQKSGTDETTDDEARAENIAILDELKEQVRKAETAKEDLQRHLDLLQARYDESQQSQSRLEDQFHEKEVRVEELEMEKVQAARQLRDMETLYESERGALFKEKEEQAQREDALEETVRRLKENLVQKEARSSSDEKATERSTDHFAPPSSLPQSSDDDLVKAIVSKDRVIESLRLEVAEAQIKIMEIDSQGGSNIHDLEKKLMDVKIENARLLEDNESFQLLLSEKTLNGDFSKADAMQTSATQGSLAEELASEDDEHGDDKSDNTRRLEAELRAAKDQNKALAVYIEKIIGRLLMHKDFDNIFDKNPDLLTGAAHPAANAAPGEADKELPPPPPPKDANQGGGFLQRARSVVAGTGRRPRPLSHVPPATEEVPEAPPTGPNEDPAKAPSIPLGRSASVRNNHKRTQSDMQQAAPIVNQMYRGPSPSGLGTPLGSPGLSPVNTAARSSFFAPQPPRVASGSASRASMQDKRPGSSSNSTFSEHSAGVDGSPPRANNFTGAVMTQNRLRPLRLVQENKEGEESAAAVAARKKANRGSWMPNWMSQRNPSVEQ